MMANINSPCHPRALGAAPYIATIPKRLEYHRQTACIPKIAIMKIHTLNNKTGQVTPAGFKETLLNAACPHGGQWHGLRYLTLS